MSQQPADKYSTAAYLCFAHGESDLPAALIATTRGAVLQFLVDEWFGEQPEKMTASNREQWDAAVDRLDNHDWLEDGPLEWNFEIGGVEITRVAASLPEYGALPWKPKHLNVYYGDKWIALSNYNELKEHARQLERELAEVRADKERLQGAHAECVVAMVPFIPAFGYLRDAIKELGARAARSTRGTMTEDDFGAPIADCIASAHRNSGMPNPQFSDWKLDTLREGIWQLSYEINRLRSASGAR